jgi:hypothetical protein
VSCVTHLCKHEVGLTVAVPVSSGSLCSRLSGITAIAVKLAGFSVVPGYASLLATITFLSGVQQMVIGMMGQYVARIGVPPS